MRKSQKIGVERKLDGNLTEHVRKLTEKAENICCGVVSAKEAWTRICFILTIGLGGYWYKGNMATVKAISESPFGCPHAFVFSCYNGKSVMFLQLIFVGGPHPPCKSGFHRPDGQSSALFCLQHKVLHAFPAPSFGLRSDKTTVFEKSFLGREPSGFRAVVRFPGVSNEYVLGCPRLRSGA